MSQDLPAGSIVWEKHKVTKYLSKLIDRWKTNKQTNKNNIDFVFKFQIVKKGGLTVVKTTLVRLSRPSLRFSPFDWKQKILCPEIFYD